MINTGLLPWWIEKYKKQIKEFVRVALEVELLSKEELEIKKMVLLIEYLDSCESCLLTSIIMNYGFETVIESIYEVVYGKLPAGDLNKKNG